jgi:hypothetical protein
VRRKPGGQVEKNAQCSPPPKQRIGEQYKKRQFAKMRLLIAAAALLALSALARGQGVPPSAECAQRVNALGENNLLLRCGRGNGGGVQLGGRHPLCFASACSMLNWLVPRLNCPAVPACCVLKHG